MWIRTEDRGWYHDHNWGALWIGTNPEIMLSLSNMKCYVDCKWCDRKFHDQFGALCELEQMIQDDVLN
jgi:hypothetical protein